MDNLVSFHTASFKGTCGWIIWNGKDVWGKSLRYRAILLFSWVKYPSSSSSLLQSRGVAFIYFRRIGLFQERKAGADLKWKAYDSLCLNVTLSRQNCQKVILLKLGFFQYISSCTINRSQMQADFLCGDLESRIGFLFWYNIFSPILGERGLL